MADSLKYAFTLLSEGGLDNQVAANEALEVIEFFSNLAIETFQQDTPPEEPVAGDGHITGAAPTGVWSGEADSVARYRRDGTWEFWAVSSLPMLRLYDKAGSAWRRWDGTSWSTE